MSLKVDFNFFNSARIFYGLKKVNLNNGFSDPTLTRETLGYELFEQIDTTFLSNNFADSTGNLYKPEMPAVYLSWTEADLQEQQTGFYVLWQEQVLVNY